MQIACVRGNSRGQQGRSPAVVAAFRSILADDPGRILRDRAAWFVASQELPKGEQPHRDWWPAILRRRAERLGTV